MSVRDGGNSLNLNLSHWKIPLCLETVTFCFRDLWVHILPFTL